MYEQNNNSDQIINMYTVTQKTARCIKRRGLEIKSTFYFSPKQLSKHFHFDKHLVTRIYQVEDNTKMYLIETWSEVVQWIHLALNRDQWTALMITVMYIQVL